MSSTITRRSTRRSHQTPVIDRSCERTLRERKPRPPPPIIVSSDSDDDSEDPLTVTPIITPVKNGKRNPDLISPSILLQKLKIQSSPSSGSKRKLFDNLSTEKENRGQQGSPTKQKKAQTYEHDNKNASVEKDVHQDAYLGAKRALHSTFPTDMPGREEELGKLHDFIAGHLNKKTSGSLYISGPPGTGKTASLNLVLENKQISTGLKHVYINCTSIKSSGSVFSKISKLLDIKCGGRTEKENCAAIENYLDEKNVPVLLVLDEIDQLVTKKQSVLYTVFEWPARPKSRLILIGIANALDLTDRILPRLQARCELKPNLMHFPPYTKQQIVEIFKNRLKEAGVLDIFTPVALQMLAGKIAAVSGDLRRALDIGRRVIDLIDENSAEDVLKSVENMIATTADAESSTIKCVDVKQVMSALSNVYSTSQNDNMDDSFPLQQKIVVCSLILMHKNSKNKDVTLGKLHEVYRKICNKKNIQAVDQSEFVGICSLIESKGIVKVIKKKDMRMSKVGLEWDEEEIAGVMKDKQLMASILEDDRILGKF